MYRYYTGMIMTLKTHTEQAQQSNHWRSVGPPRWQILRAGSLLQSLFAQRFSKHFFAEMHIRKTKIRK